MKLLPFSLTNDQPVPIESPSYSDGTNTYYFRPIGSPENINAQFVQAILQGAASAIPCLTPVFLTDDQRSARFAEQQSELVKVQKKISDMNTEIGGLDDQLIKETDKNKKRLLKAQRLSVINRQKEQTKLESKITNDMYRLQQFDKPYNAGNAKDPSNTVVIQSASFTNGALLYLQSSLGTAIPMTQQVTIVTELMEILDERLRSIYYKGLTDADSPLTWTPPTPTPAAPPAQPVNVLETLMRISLFDMEFIGASALGKNANAISTMKLRIGTGKDWDNTDGFPFRFFFRVKDPKLGWCLWVPKTMPNIYVEPNDTDYYYEPSGTAGAYTRKDKPGVSILPCYMLDGTNTIQPVLPFGESVRSGAGGGAMRSDRVTEADYKWSGNRELGYALNLDMNAYIPTKINPDDVFDYKAMIDWLPAPAGYQKTRTPYMSSDSNMNSEIVYFKKFNDPNPGKKNLPKSTFPLPSDRFLKSGFNTLGQFVKKKKGVWEFGGGVFGKTGEVLKHMNTERESAGSVMRDAFNDMKFTVDGTDLGSATQFANWVVQNDQRAKAYWADASQDVKLFSDHVMDDLNTLKQQIRTSQEWCHLYGHGDGGSEEVGNFISGSKHCNTEQLAIETGQRYQKYDDLTVKITGYLMPNQGFAKTAFTNYDIAYLKHFDPAAINLNDQAAAAAAMKNYMDQYPKIDLAPYLFSMPDATSGPVPTKEAYAKMNGYQQSRVKKDVYEMFRNILTLYYPLGVYVRYKIYDKGKKIFDHSFSAQSESFDLNQFNILTHTVKRVIATSKGVKDEFAEAVNMKLKTRLQGEQVEGIKTEFASSEYKIR